MKKAIKTTPIDLTFDAAFKLYFKKNLSLLMSLLKDFLPLPENSTIMNVELMDSELEPISSDNPAGKKFILDIMVEIHTEYIDKKQPEKKEIKSEIVNVEMQASSQKNFSDRILAYNARIYSDQIKEGEYYNKLHPVYSLVFMTTKLKEFDVDELANEYCHICNLRRNKYPDLTLNNGMQFIIVELAKFRKRLKKVVDQKDAWCYLLKNAEQIDKKIGKKLMTKGKDMKNAVNHLWKLSEDKLAKRILEAEDKRRRDIAAQKAWEREEGIVIGIEKGIEKGIEQGREKGKEDVAINLLKNGIKIPIISKSTGISQKKLKVLQKKEGISNKATDK